MNIVTIKFGQGTEAWKDMQEVAKVLVEKGYSAQPYEEIGTVKLAKKLNKENKKECTMDDFYTVVDGLHSKGYSLTELIEAIENM